MNTNTALGAASNAKAQTLTFRNKEHRDFFFQYISKCRLQIE